MSAFKSLKQGLTEAAAHAKGKQTGVSESQPLRGRCSGLGKRLGLMHEQFAARCGFPVATLRQGNAATELPTPRPRIAVFNRPGTQGCTADFGCVSAGADEIY